MMLFWENKFNILYNFSDNTYFNIRFILINLIGRIIISL